MSKNKYLEFREKPYNSGKWVANIDVTHMNKIEIDVKQALLVRTTFPEDKYASCVTTTKDFKKVWLDVPEKPSWSEIMESWKGWDSAPGYLTAKSFAEFLDGNFESPINK